MGKRKQSSGIRQKHTGLTSAQKLEESNRPAPAEARLTWHPSPDLTEVEEKLRARLRPFLNEPVDTKQDYYFPDERFHQYKATLSKEEKKTAEDLSHAIWLIKDQRRPLIKDPRRPKLADGVWEALSNALFLGLILARLNLASPEPAIANLEAEFQKKRKRGGEQNRNKWLIVCREVQKRYDELTKHAGYSDARARETIQKERDDDPEKVRVSPRKLKEYVDRPR